MGKTHKVVVCGARGIGKTAIIQQLIYGNVNKDTVFYPTIEDVYAATVETDRGGREILRFYDTTGVVLNPRTREQAEIPRHLICVADAYVLMYAINSQESFNLMDAVKKDIDKNREKKEVAFLVLGTKLDLVEERQVDYTQACSWAAKERVKFCEVSLYDHQSLFDPFVYLASRISPPPPKSTFPQLPQLSMVRKTKE